MEANAKSKASLIREELRSRPRAKAADIVAALQQKGAIVKEKAVYKIKSEMRHKKGKRNRTTSASGSSQANYPRHQINEVLRIPKAILEQNAGKECSLKDCASFIGVKATSGEYHMEISSATKYGLIEKAGPGRVKLGDLAREILRPQAPGQDLQALRRATIQSPQMGDVYNHYRGENLPDDTFFANTLTDTFHIPPEKVDEFKKVFIDTFTSVQLLEEREGKFRVLDISSGEGANKSSSERIKKMGKDVQISSDDTCFVVMPFLPPQGTYYASIYEPAIKKAGLKAVRADNEIFGSGKIMDQIWRGINAAKVLVAELTTKNPNVFYELGLAHAMKKPVVLVSANEKDVPFDLQHIRVIYYDVNDPFWGEKLQAKIAENIISAIKNPEEAIFKSGISEAK